MEKTSGRGCIEKRSQKIYPAILPTAIFLEGHNKRTDNARLLGDR